MTAKEQLEFWHDRLSTPSFVYFVQPERGPVKIGRAVDPALRLRDLQCGSPVPLFLRYVVPGDWRTERYLHDRFWPWHSHGEWFDEGFVSSIIRYAEGVSHRVIDLYPLGGAGGRLPKIPGPDDDELAYHSPVGPRRAHRDKRHMRLSPAANAA